MVIKSVLFSGALSRGNVLKIKLDESYLPIRFGEWRMRVDTMSVTMKKKNDSFHVALCCSLLQSPQEVTLPSGSKVTQVRHIW